MVDNHVTAKPRRKSATSPKNPKLPSPRPEPTMIKRRNSSLASTSSPWFRRNSFLSNSMIQNENFQVYESSYNNNYNIISLKEYQGFIFNQDLFATPYQQLRSLAIEKTRRLNSMSNGNNSACLRRHTSYHPQRPSLNESKRNSEDNDVAIEDDDEDDEDAVMVDEQEEEEEEDDDDEYEEMQGYGGDQTNRRYKVRVTEIVINEKESDIFPN
ncbi:hypothetical protein Cantr_01752 [Candida viswanathii]|uniref:Uncharacterized protein n=1 Tax=Candida viswanathii TaxID=5486 RepID=A0A367YM28_9ASCO|nr:hypothetical protein Cantr_01752 [Candida viswanathii]